MTATLALVALVAVALGAIAFIAVLRAQSPISGVLARPGVVYQVGPVAHVVPELVFGRQRTWLVHARELARMRDLLRYVDRLLDGHGVPYWVSGGTMLGAARHGGFIPWDDDIDLQIELRDLPRVRALAPVVRRDGFVLLEAAGGLKLAYGDRRRYPYVDLVVVDRQDGRFRLCFPLDRDGRPTFGKAAQWPNECLPIDAVLPAKRVAFEDFEVSAPHDLAAAVRGTYGERAMREVRHRGPALFRNHFAFMLWYRLGLSRG